MKRILIIDDHTMFRQAVIAILMEGMSEEVRCDDAGSAARAREKLLDNGYDLVIMDISMSDVSGIDLLPELRLRYPSIPVLMLSMHPEDQFALQSLHLGANGYMTKQEAADELLAAVRKILDGGMYVSRSLSRLLLDQALHRAPISGPAHQNLSRRELDILKRLAAGQRQKDIANELGLSIKTISTYKTRLSAKMGFSSNADLLRYALQNRLQ